MKKIIVILAALVVFVSCKPEERPSAIEDMVVSTLNVSFNKLATVDVKSWGNSESEILYMVGYFTESLTQVGTPAALDWENPSYYRLARSGASTYDIYPHINISAKKQFIGYVYNDEYMNIDVLKGHPLQSSYLRPLQFSVDPDEDSKQQTYIGATYIYYKESTKSVEVTEVGLLPAKNEYTVVAVDAKDLEGNPLEVKLTNLFLKSAVPTSRVYWDGSGVLANLFVDSFTEYSEINDSADDTKYVDFSMTEKRRQDYDNACEFNKTLYLPNCTGFAFKGTIGGQEIDYDEILPDLFSTLNPRNQHDNGYCSSGVNSYKITLHITIDKAKATAAYISQWNLDEKEVDVNIVI